MSRGADADGASYRTVCRRRQRDIEFLTWVRNATLSELREAERQMKKWPQWKKVAIERALGRVTE